MANNREDKGEEKKEDNEVRKEEIENLNEELKRDISTILKDVQAELNDISTLFQIPTTTTINPDIINKWRQLLNTITPDVRDHIITKENIELLNSAIVALQFIFDYNTHKWLAKLSSDKCSIERFIKLITIKKIGVQLLQFKLNRFNTIIEALKVQGDMYKQVVNALSQIAQNIPSSIDIAQNLKWVSINATLIAALAAISIEIGNLKGDLRTLVFKDDELCLQGCSAECRGGGIGIIGMTSEKSGEEFNEGKAVKEITDQILQRMLKLMDIELDEYMKRLNEDKQKG